VPRVDGSQDPGFVLSTNLARIKKERGLTNRQIADMAGVSHSSLSTLMTGKVRNPGAYFLYRVALALRVPMEDLMGVSRLAGRVRIARANSGDESLTDILEAPIDSVHG
jgi:transcriptional regulator with XRE-family HTH domain